MAVVVARKKGGAMFVLLVMFMFATAASVLNGSRRPLREKFFLPFLSVLFLVAGGGCQKKIEQIEIVLPDGTKERLAVEETLRINITSEPPSLDWHKATDTTSSHITGNTMEGLLEYDLADKNLSLVPALATGWKPSDQARKWTFTLREGVVWNDGVAFTSQHVLDGWKRLLAKETASEYAYFLFPIKNARAFNEGKVDFGQVGVKAMGPHEIAVELEKPMSYFPHLLTHHSTYPVRMDVVGKHGDRWTEPGRVVTLGPYNLKAWQHDKIIVLERNDKYYGTRPAIKNIAAYMIQEQATAINLFESGKLDSVHGLPSVELRKIKGRPEHRQTTSLSLYYYGMNVRKPPMDKPLVRKAIAMAIDRNELVRMLGGGQVATSSWVPAGMFGHEAERGLKFDPEKAKELLKQAGYSDLSRFPKLEVKFNTNEDHQRVAENIQAQLKRNLGINVELKNEEWKVYLNSIKSDPPHLFRFGWLADYPDPDNFLSVLASYSDNNRTGWTHPEYDRLVLKGASLSDQEERRKVYSEAQQLLLEEEVPVIPLFTSVSHLLVSERLENYPVNVMLRSIYKGVRIK